jgi:hypothetical protein
VRRKGSSVRNMKLGFGRARSETVTIVVRPFLLVYNGSRFIGEVESEVSCLQAFL